MMNETILKTLKHAIHNASTIERCGSSFAFTGGGNTKVFTTEELGLLDSRLPIAVEYLVEHHKQTAADSIRRTLAHWSSPAPSMEGNPGVKLVNMRKLTYIPDIDGYVVMTDRYKTITLVGMCELAMTTNKNAPSTVSTEWLRAHYPEEEKKMLILYSLGLPTDSVTIEHLDAMQPTQANLSLDGVSFG